jgi:hypothetical protein
MSKFHLKAELTNYSCKMLNSDAKKLYFIFFGKILLMIVFAISVQQWPLYIGNYNTYLLHGYANANVGFLNQDWLAQTTDPFPLFSTLVGITILYFDENTFYFYQIIIIFIYSYSIVGICSYIFKFDNDRIVFLSFFLILTALYSGILYRRILQLPGLSDFAFYFRPSGILTTGVAEQEIIGHIFQPSVFGVFIVLSIYNFLNDKHYLSVLYLAIASTFHSTYLLSAIVLTFTYLITIIRQSRNFKKVLLVGLFAFVLVLPILTYNYLNFFPTDSYISNQAYDILVEYRIPHHAKPSHWFSNYTLIQIGVAVLAIYLLKSTKLFTILLLPFLTTIILTFVQIYSSNKALALLFPWRMSVFLIPIASSIILANITLVTFRIFNRIYSNNLILRIFQVAIILMIIFIGFRGIEKTINLYNSPKIGDTPSTRFITRTYQPGNIYLVPPDLETVRLAARVPIFIDYKSHPYKDTEVVEWFRRISFSEKFYVTNAQTSCNMLKNKSSIYGITHVVIIRGTIFENCNFMHEVYKDKEFRIYELFTSQE